MLTWCFGENRQPLFVGSVLDCEEIWIFGALCLYWCDVELHI